jgi:hypothetical protein
MEERSLYSSTLSSKQCYRRMTTTTGTAAAVVLRRRIATSKGSKKGESNTRAQNAIVVVAITRPLTCTPAATVGA